MQRGHNYRNVLTLEGKNKDETKEKALHRMQNNGLRKRVRDRDE